MAGPKSECEKRNCKIFGLSVHPVEDHRRWAKDITSWYAVIVRTDFNERIPRVHASSPTAPNCKLVRVVGDILGPLTRLPAPGTPGLDW